MSSHLSPPTRTLCGIDYACQGHHQPPSVVPPPMSPTMLPLGSVIGKTGPDGRGQGSSTVDLARPGLSALSLTGTLFDLGDSEGDTDDGCRLTRVRRLCSRREVRSIASGTSNSGVTPVRRGRIRLGCCPGVRPSISLWNSRPPCHTFHMPPPKHAWNFRRPEGLAVITMHFP